MNEHIAELNKAAAVANEKAEQERLARVKIEQKMAPRHLSPAQQKRLSESLKRYAGQKLNVFVYATSLEAVTFGNELIAALGPQGAGWILSVSRGQEGVGRAVPGMLVELRPYAMDPDPAVARALVAALSHEGFSVGGPDPLQEPAMMGMLNQDPSATIKLTIGNKP
jgi:hypothetical protein